MAIRLPRRIKPVLTAAVAIGAAVVLVPTVASATPDAPPPAGQSVASVQQRLGELALKNTQLVERYNQAQVQVDKLHHAADAAAAKAKSADAAFQNARAALSTAIAAQYEGGSFSATGALLSSDSGEKYLERLNTLTMVSDHTAQIVARLDAAQRDAKAATKQATSLLAQAETQRDAVAKQKKTVETKIGEYKQLLGTLTAAQRAAFARTQNPAVTPPPQFAAKVQAPSAGVSVSAQRAVQFALAQVGKPYVFGAAGPDSYDCSGLTMAAWAAGGVSLPHSAADQYNYGTHVSVDALQPGDLIFMYSPIGHVTIYIGDGLMVSAPTEGENVSVVPVSSFSGDIVGATHLG